MLKMEMSADLGLMLGNLGLEVRVTWKVEFDSRYPVGFAISEIEIDRINSAYHATIDRNFKIGLSDRESYDDFREYVRALILTTSEAERQIEKYMTTFVILKDEGRA